MGFWRHATHPVFDPRFISLLLLFLASSAFAQAPEQMRVKEAVQVRAAEIEVLVLDANGRPVTDLHREEFVLTIDGVAQKIDWILPPFVPNGGLASATEPLVATSPDASLTLQQQPALTRSTVFFVDDLHLDFRSRLLGLRALKDHLRKLPPLEEAAVYSFRHSLRVVQRFTTDRAAITAALERLGRTTPVSQLVESREQWVSQSGGALSELSWMLRNLAGRPEPKTVIVLAGYLPLTSWELSRPLESTSFNFSEQVRETSREAFLARATIVALDPSGVPVSGTPAWAATTLTPPKAEQPAPAADADDSRSDIASDSDAVPRDSGMDSGGDTFAVLARETGGTRLSLSNQPGRLLEAETERLNSRYRIGFTPDAETSETRRIGVRVTRPGLRVRTASGQRSHSGETLVRARFASSLLGTDIGPADFPIRVVEEKNTSSASGAKTLSFEVRVPMREVFLQDRGETLEGRVEILVAAMDEDGGMSEVQSQAVDVRVSKKDASRIPHSYFQTPLSLEAHGRGRILVGVRDTTTNRLGKARVPYRQ